MLGPGFGRLLGSARVESVKNNGKLVGYEFKSMRPNSDFLKFGLKIGDVVESVNGFPVSDPSKAMMLLQTLRNESNISVRVLRSGRPVSVNITFE